MDLISLGVGVVDVLANPYDPLSWLGLVGDIVDLIPCVTGVGDSVRMVKLSVSMADDTHDVVRTMRKVYSSIPDTGDVVFCLKLQALTKLFTKAVIDILGRAVFIDQQFLRCSIWLKMIRLGKLYGEVRQIQCLHLSMSIGSKIFIKNLNMTCSIKFGAQDDAL